MGNYIPRADAVFDVWQKNLMTHVVAKATAWGIPAARVTALTGLQKVWAEAFLKYNELGTEKGGGTLEKNTAREGLETPIRDFVSEWLAANSNITDADRGRMGLTVESDTHTPVAVPATLPLLKLDISVPMQHTVRFTDDSGKGRGKPEGVHGCEIWAKVEDTASKEPAKFEFLATSTRSPYVKTFAAADAGKKVTYRGRWVNTKGQPGPFGPEVHSLVVD